MPPAEEKTVSYLAKFPANPHPNLPNCTHRLIPAGNLVVSVVHFKRSDSWELALLDRAGNLKADIECYYEPAEVEFAIHDWVQLNGGKVKPNAHPVN